MPKIAVHFTVSKNILKENRSSQVTSTVLMIEPVNFGFNEETASSNAFQQSEGRTRFEEIQHNALKEFNLFTEKLKENKIKVITFKDNPTPFTPDSIFPNNWVTFHEDGTVVLFPMEAHNRRLERKKEIIEALREKHNYQIRHIIDLSQFENQNKYLEGTGSMIIDRENKLVYACLSSRTDKEVLDKFCSIFQYEAVTFTSTDANNFPVYHTNVMMAVGKNIAIICLESIKNKKERDLVTNHLTFTGKAIIEISLEQMHQFSGNMLQLVNTEGRLILVMSTQAYSSLTKDQTLAIIKHTDILHSDIRNIEAYGGGSVRCMMAEIFLSKRSLN